MTVDTETCIRSQRNERVYWAPDGAIAYTYEPTGQPHELKAGWYYAAMSGYPCGPYASEREAIRKYDEIYKSK